MSKPSVSPYRRNAYNNRPGVSPLREEPYKLSEKSKLSHSFIAEHNTEKKAGAGREETLRITDKKRNPEYTVGHSRLDTLVEQNKFLLAENNELANLLNDRSRIIIALEHKLEQQIAQEVQTLEEIQFEKNRFLEQYGHKMREHSARNECLMDEIAQLNEDIYQLEVRKNREIEHIKQSYSREHKTQLENILSNHAETLQLMNIESSKLKEIIGNRDHEIECLNHELKSTHDRLKSKCEELQRNLTHVMHMKKLELSDQKMHYEKVIENTKRENQKKQEVNNSQYENQIRRVKKELLAKQIEVEKLGNDMNSNHIDSQTKINELYQKKGELENQISQLESFQKTLIFEQTQRINNLAQAELENCDAMNRQLLDSLRRQNAKLAELNQTRGNQITKLYVQIEDLRFKAEREGDDLRLQIENLKSLIQNEKLFQEQKNQAFKIKIAHLRHADIHSLQEYYQNELGTMAEDLQAKEHIIKENRDKIHAEIQEKTQMRKNFEIEVSKLKIRIGELQLKVAGIIHERKQDIANFGSQMQLTSMSLLRTAQEKEKYAIFSQSQKQRLQKMIENKDRQIEQLNDKIKMMGENHGIEVGNKNDQIQILKKTIQELESNLKKQKFFLENEVKKKEAIIRNDKEFYQSEIAKVKRQTADEYNKILAELTNEKGMIDSERIRLKKIGEELSGELRQVKDFREQQNLDKEIAINQSMGRVATEKEILEVNLRGYFNKELSAKDTQIKNLRQQIAQLNIDVRSHMEKEQRLEQKLQKLLESQEKLREMEQRVLGLGQENNLVKNLGEIVKRRK